MDPTVPPAHTGLTLTIADGRARIAPTTPEAAAWLAAKTGHTAPALSLDDAAVVLTAWEHRQQ